MPCEPARRNLKGINRQGIFYSWKRRNYDFALMSQGLQTIFMLMLSSFQWFVLEFGGPQNTNTKFHMWANGKHGIRYVCVRSLNAGYVFVVSILQTQTSARSNFPTLRDDMSDYRDPSQHSVSFKNWSFWSYLIFPTSDTTKLEICTCFFPQSSLTESM